MLSVDAKNPAIEKLKAQKKTGADAEPFGDPRTPHATGDNNLAAIAECDHNLSDVLMEADTPEAGCGSSRHR